MDYEFLAGRSRYGGETWTLSSRLPYRISRNPHDSFTWEKCLILSYLLGNRGSRSFAKVSQRGEKGRGGIPDKPSAPCLPPLGPARGRGPGHSPKEHAPEQVTRHETTRSDGRVLACTDGSSSRHRRDLNLRSPLWGTCHPGSGMWQHAVKGCWFWGTFGIRWNVSVFHRFGCCLLSARQPIFHSLGIPGIQLLWKMKASKPLARLLGFQSLTPHHCFYLGCGFVCRFTKTMAERMERQKCHSAFQFLCWSCFHQGREKAREGTQDFCWIRNHFCWTLVASNLFCYSKEERHRTAWQNEFMQVQRFSFFLFFFLPGKKGRKSKKLRNLSSALTLHRNLSFYLVDGNSVIQSSN